MISGAATIKPMAPVDVREQLVKALQLDLVGPWPGHELAEEHLFGWQRPSNWYLTGFLVPAGTPMKDRGDMDEDEDFGETPADGGLAEEGSDERRPAKKGFFPSSVGLSFLVDSETDRLDVLIQWGDYRRASGREAGYDVGEIWERIPREERVSLSLRELPPTGTMSKPVPDSHGLVLEALVRTVPPRALGDLIPPGTRSVSVFLVNRREPGDDEAYAFQVGLEVKSERPFVPRPDPRGARAEGWDERVAALHYADTPEFAVGHGVSADWDVVDGHCRVLRTTWLPSAQVERTETKAIEGVELSMDALGRLEDGEAASRALLPLVEAYRKWIREWEDRLPEYPERLRPTAEALLHDAKFACEQIQRGIDMLARDPDALGAFRVANRAVARALKQRIKVEWPEWRAFQLAFILLNLPGLIDPEDAQREVVELLFFPTGGGKTEAYLGLAAFAIVLRRLRNPEVGGRAGAGVTVIMRYTLRLLTIDQLSRAAGLMCALELEREQNPSRYGEWPFEIGLWVGKAATPNAMGRKGDSRPDTARVKVNQFKANPQGKPSPIPLEECPWCQERFKPESFSLEPDSDYPTNLRVVCTNFECEFSGNRPLPIVAVDEPLYRRLPAFLIATVDKFATLPWVGRSGVLLGGADRWDESGFYGLAEPGKGQKLPKPLLPPDLIIQDELHLISGPLGTMAGLYETAIDALCTREGELRKIRPKIVASTATVRRAQEQIQALFARPITRIFPPPGPDRRDSFFARSVPVGESPGRLYLGVSAPGRNPKVAFRRTWLALMGAAQRAFMDAGGEKNKDNPADPYMTVLGYFNSLRELGGARRILEEEIQNTIKDYGMRRRLNEYPGLFRERRHVREVLELTSRVSTNKVAEARRRLAASYCDDNARVDCAIATNMISVGLDIRRLGLMVVFGQPKTSSEYIQATSRVGRDPQKPGLVVTLLNVHKPRDRSHYERFRHYHETFYRSVEVASVTPFAARAVDRGFAGTLVSLARHSYGELAPPQGTERIAGVRASLERDVLAVFRDRLQHQLFPTDEERAERERSIQNRIVGLLDAWEKIVDGYRSVGAQVQYQKHELKHPKPLLRDMLEQQFDIPEQRLFRVNRSLRDVEPAVNLYIRDLGN